MTPNLDYQLTIDFIEDKNIIPEEIKSEIVVEDFRGLPIECEFQKLYNFYQGNIFKQLQLINSR